jgi:hypothetical protein
MLIFSITGSLLAFEQFFNALQVHVLRKDHTT